MKVTNLELPSICNEQESARILAYLLLLFCLKNVSPVAAQAALSLAVAHSNYLHELLLINAYADVTLLYCFLAIY